VTGRTLAAGEQQLENRQGETGGLAGAGLGRDHEITTFQHGRDGLRLDRSGGGVTSGSHGAHQRVGQAERSKGHSDKPCDGRLRTGAVSAAGMKMKSGESNRKLQISQKNSADGCQNLTPLSTAEPLGRPSGTPGKDENQRVQRSSRFG